MMKKITLLLSVIFLSFSIFAQKATTLLSEDFSGSFPPNGWTIDDMASQWSQSSSAKAGGTAPEARLKYISGTHTTRLISPEIDLTGLSTVIFSFKHFLDDFNGSGGYTVGVATRSGIGSWNDVWTTDPTGDMGPEIKDIVISNSDVGASDFQVCIYLTGNMYNFDYWYIDEISLISPDNNDAVLQSINVNPYAAAANIHIKCTFNNTGINIISSADLNYQIDNGTVITENVTGLNLTTTQSHDYTFTTPWAAIPGNYNLKVWISGVNGNGSDDDQTNDTLNLEMHIATQSVARTPLYEEFTSSTCSPCATFNSTYFTTDFLNTNAGKFSLIKYQMSWPDPGDDYYTAEGGVRRAYYGVSGVPTLFIDANEGTHFNTSQLQTDLDNETAKPAFFDIDATHQISGNTISIQTDILPYLDASDFTVQIEVVEKTTTGNVGSNGETEFHHVMMKMLPDASGTNCIFSAGTHTYLSQTYDMSSTNVEEMSDLEVIVFIQNDKTKEVFQSAVSQEAVLPAPEVSFFPINGSSDVDVNTNIEISFNQYMRLTDNSEINNTNIANFVSLSDPSKADIPYTATINDSKSLIILTPNTYLPELTNITVTISDAAIEGTNDASLSGAFVTFTTATYPAANVGFNPAAGTTDVDVTSDIVLTFDNPMRKVDDSEITDADISSFISITDPSKANIAYTGTINTEKTIITIHPENYLTELTNVTTTISGNSIENIYNLVLAETSATFTTAAYPAANVNFSPADGTTDVDIHSDIILTFDNPMRKIDNSEITDADISSFVSLIDANGDIAYTGSINAEKTVITLNPDESLPILTDITITISGNETENIFDNSMPETSATFTTKSAVNIPNISATVLIAPNPADNYIRISGINIGQITITDISGKQVLSSEIKSDSERINIQAFPSGVYIINIISEGKIYINKFIKK